MGVNIGILSSSRADYSIYLPLAKALQNLPQTRVSFIVFGSHLEEKYGLTIKAIEQDQMPVYASLPNTIALSDTPKHIALAMGKTVSVFSEFWENAPFDLVFCLGDRYEMFSAVLAALPYQIPLAHLYGGEKTLGAIDDPLRHAISLMSQWHFTSCEPYAQRVKEIVGPDAPVFNVGHLSMDNLNSLPLLSIDELKDKIGINFQAPTLLCTFHPETVHFKNNEFFANEIAKAFEDLTHFQVLITMPNADTGGDIIRDIFLKLSKKHARIITSENLGTLAYLSAMKYCYAMVGNTSSGFVEASYFPKWVINLGDRQKGRIETENIITIPIEKQSIVNTILQLENKNLSIENIRIYGNGDVAKKITSIVQNHLLKNRYS